MADLLYVVLTVAFFALAVGLVRGCDRVIGPDEAMLDQVHDGADAHTAERDGRSMSAENVVGLVIAILLCGYLVATLLWPERF